MDSQTPDLVPAAAPVPPVTTLPSDAPWWARWMVANAREAVNWWSVRWPLICAFGCEVYAAYGDQIIAYIPVSWRPHIAAAAFLVGVFLRLKRQLPKDPK
jgi:hypothetical protein